MIPKETLHNPSIQALIECTTRMKQISLAPTGFELATKRTRKQIFLDEMNLVVPRAELVKLIQPFAPAAGSHGGRTAFAVETMLRIRFL